MAQLNDRDAESSFRVDPLLKRFVRWKKVCRGLLVGHRDYHRGIAVRREIVDQRFPEAVAVGHPETSQTEVEILDDQLARRAGIVSAAQEREQCVGPEIDVAPARWDHGTREIAKIHQCRAAPRRYFGNGFALLGLKQH